MKRTLLTYPVFRVVKFVSKRAIPVSGAILNGILLYETYINLKKKYPFLDTLLKQLKTKILNQFKSDELPNVVQGTLSVILRDRLISKEEVNNLQRSDYSKAILGADYPVLKQIPNNKISTNKKIDGKVRYFDEVYKYGSEQYLIISEWSDSQKDKYLSWLKSID